MLPFKIESCIWLGIVWFAFLVRIIARRLLFGSWKRLQVEDYLMLLAVLAYTVLIACINVLLVKGTSLILPEEVPFLTPHDIQERVFGSKLVVVVEQMQCLIIWLVKACLLLMYYRLTMSLRLNLIVKIVGVYVAIGFVIMELLYFSCWCRPFSQYWAVPPSSDQCSATGHHLIVNAVFNLSSDLMIISIPIPIIVRARLPTKRKLVLCCVFGVGFFTIASAILNKYYSFMNPYGLDWTFWYIRESATSIVVANLPPSWTLLQRVFGLGSFARQYYKTHTPSIRRLSRIHSQASSSRSRRSTAHEQIPTALDRSGSEGYIDDGGIPIPLGIYKRRDSEISTGTGPTRSESSRRRDTTSSTNSFSNGARTTFATQTGSQASDHVSEEPSSEESTSGLA